MTKSCKHVERMKHYVLQIFNWETKIRVQLEETVGG